MQKKSKNIILIVSVLIVVTIIASLAIIFGIKHFKNKDNSSIKTNTSAESSNVSSDTSSVESLVSSAIESSAPPVSSTVEPVVSSKPVSSVYVPPKPTIELIGNYLNISPGLIAEVIHFEAETFDALSTNDWSKPTNTYLPKGTVDYCSPDLIYSKGSGEKKEYAVLRCNKQIYTKNKNTPHTEKIQVAKIYEGTLPDHNEIGAVSLENGTSHSTLTLSTMWKAPFRFDIAPQNYNRPSSQDYKITDFTANYIDITFCYATVFSGELIIPEDNPLFSFATVIPNYDTNGNIVDTTLRLNLKKTGGFYGWNAFYNDQGQLIFEFLNPAKIAIAENEFGVDLTGVKILVDVGHGGKDVGAEGFDYLNNSEAKRNLILAKKLGDRLVGLGATVYLTREDDITSSNDDKLQKLERIKPDICISIHHNSSSNTKASGFDSCYFTPFSMKSAQFIYQNTAFSNIYQKNYLKWHYYFFARNTLCPIVLTENGYISNEFDYQNIINDDINNLKADAITRGIAEYFKSIQ